MSLRFNRLLRAISSGISTFRSIGALGANIEQPNSTMPNRLFTNAFYNGARMCKTGQFGVNCTRDATTGWPTEPFYVCLSQGLSNGATTTITRAAASYVMFAVTQRSTNRNAYVVN